MNSSIEDLVRVAREDAIADFKFRFMQKWYANKPCFHWKELRLSKEISDLLITDHPCLWFFSYHEEIDLEDKKWEKNELHNFLIFDWIQEESKSINESEMSSWLDESIKTALVLFETNQDNLMLCYYEGSHPYSAKWRSLFEKQLKV